MSESTPVMPTVEPQAIQKVESPQIPTPMVILARAVAENADLDKIEKLMVLQERWEKREAEKAFVAALAAFKKAPPEIAKNKKVSYQNAKGQTVEYKHATLDRVTGGIGAALGEHGLSARWKTVQEGARIRVTCILQHQMGHAEETTLEASPDDSGSKNNIQAIGSTVTYLERYTLLAATGLATRDDSDGISFGDAEDMIASISSAASLEELQERFNKIYKRAYAAKDKAAMAIAIETKDQRKKEIENPAQRKARDEFDKKWEARGVNQANRQMAIGKANGDFAAADKDLEERFPSIDSGGGPQVDPELAKASSQGHEVGRSSDAQGPATGKSLAKPPEQPPTPETAAPKGAKGRTAKASKGGETREAAPPAPAPEKVGETKDFGF